MEKTVLITGCSSGIGRATALAFLEADWRVYATSRDADDLDDLAEAGCATAALDVTDGEQVASVVDRVLEGSGRIDCLVNNAGYGQFGAIEDVPVEELRRQFDVNVHGPHRLTRAVLPHMREREDGTIVNLSSVLGRISAPGSGPYSASKFALEAMSDALRGEVEGFGVDVVLVEPGSVETAFAERVDAELDRGIDRSVAYERLYATLEDAKLVGGRGPIAIRPEDVAAVVLNAASCTDPAPRYPVGPIAKYALLARFVPDRWRDAVYRMAMRLVG